MQIETGLKSLALCWAMKEVEFVMVSVLNRERWWEATAFILCLLCGGVVPANSIYKKQGEVVEKR